MSNNRRLALIIANNQYENSTFAQLTAPVQDAEELARVFNDPTIGQFDDVKVLLNEPHSTIRRAIAEFFNQKKHDDMLVVYFSGHGVLDARSQLFLAAKDSEPAPYLLWV